MLLGPTDLFESKEDMTFFMFVLSVGLTKKKTSIFKKIFVLQAIKAK